MPSVVNPLSIPDWNERILAFPECTVFHTAEWCRLLVETYGHRPCYLQLQDEAGIAALLPMIEVNSWLTGKRGVCLPFADFCRPVAGREAGSWKLGAGERGNDLPTIESRITRLPLCALL